MEEHFTYQATGVWDKTVADKTSTFIPSDGRYLAIQVFSVGGDGNTITCAEIGFKKGNDTEFDQGRIAQLSEELKELRDRIGKPAVDKTINEKLSEIEGQTFTKEGVAQIEKKLQEMIDTYSNLGNVPKIESGKVWLDTDGEVIQVHSGNINYDKKTKTYYWYGDHKGVANIPTGATTGNPVVGVGCYSSKDMYNWTNEGVVFPVFNNPQLVDGSAPNDDYPMYLSEQTKEYKESPLQEFPRKTIENGKPVVSKAPFETLSQYCDDAFIEKANKLYEDLTYEEKQGLYHNFNWNKVVERPKVIYNEKTDKYVMWWHQDGPAVGQYTDAMAGVAISDSATGPFKFIGTKRLLPDNPQKTGMLRDMNLFVDDDGTGYLIYASEENATTIIHKLNEDYTDVSGTVEGKDYVKIFVGNYREAPAVFKERNTYYLVTSGQTGWNPNPCKYSYTEGKLLSTDWSENRTFCINDYDLSGQTVTDPERGTTFHSQSTWILPNRDKEGNKIPGQYVYIGDRWFPNDLKDSRYIWLPLNFDAEEKTITMEWKDTWSFEEIFGKPEHTVDKSDITALIDYAKSQQEKEEYKYVVLIVKEKFEKALADAESVNAKTDATQEEVDAAYAALQNAIFGLRLIPNKEKLEDLINEVEKMDLSMYTDETVSAVRNALEDAKAVLKNQDVIQAEVDKAVKRLQASVDGLEDTTVKLSDNKSEDKDDKKSEAVNNGKKSAKTGDATLPIGWGVTGSVAILAFGAVVSAKRKKIKM